MNNAFRKTGLHPFSAYALDYNDLFKKQRNDIDPLLTTSKENIDEHLCLIEANIEVPLLEQFKEVEKTGTWNGSLNNLGLFFSGKKF